MKKKVLIGMSGGVDSSVAAYILLKNGYDVTGVTLKLFEGNSSCCSLDDVEDARNVCIKLGIEHLVFNFKDIFKEKVIDYFVQSYQKGETPNPCIACNQFVKFDKMLEVALTLGFDFIATGHYAKICNNKLLKSVDYKKDQTYFLCLITEEQISRTLFPVGDFEKEEIRKIAEENGFLNARKKDSQDICFVADKKYSALFDENMGDFILKDGTVVGKHTGHTKFTIGQRKGIQTSLNVPAYVIGKNIDKNQVIIGNNKDLYTSELFAKNVIFRNFECDLPTKVTAKIRYSQKEFAATMTKTDNRFRLVFDEPQRAVTLGQIVAIYSGEVCVGGGIITENSKI